MKVNILDDHSLLQHKLTQLRKKDTTIEEFRRLIKEVGMLLCYEVTRDLPLKTIKIETPLCEMETSVLCGKEIVVVPILRAGLGMVDGILQVISDASVGHVGMVRDKETLLPHEYCVKLPSDLDKRVILVVDPMLATGGSAVKTIDYIKRVGGENDIRLICLLGASEGVEAVNKAHPDVSIYLGCLDPLLNEKGYIVPGLGDAGDRIFGTVGH
jgi:uracil phosphoribosyltransferase